MEYDIIGDIHGHAKRLRLLLEKLGYSEKSGVYRHYLPSRTVIFLGDIMDRGPDQIEALDIVRRMCDAGTACCIMGNHEHAAIGWTMKDPYSKNEFLRPHNPNNTRNHKEFLRQVGEGSSMHKELVRWMSSLPMYLERPEIRCVHACWHETSLNNLSQYGVENGLLKGEQLIQSFRNNTVIRDSVDTLIRGHEIDLPEDISFTDRNGTLRHKSRVKWWGKEKPVYLHDLVVDDLDCGSAKAPQEDLQPDTETDTRPIFFGHYWMIGQPTLMSEKIACLDYSVAAGGVLTAYQWRGEMELDDKNLIWV